MSGGCGSMFSRSVGGSVNFGCFLAKTFPWGLLDRRVDCDKKDTGKGE